MNTLLAFIVEKYYQCTRHSGVSLTTKPANQHSKEITQRNTIDPIRFVALPYTEAKLTSSVFAYKKQFKSMLFMLHVSRQTYRTVTDLFLWSDK